jgi:hypothetical protein
MVVAAKYKLHNLVHVLTTLPSVLSIPCDSNLSRIRMSHQDQAWQHLYLLLLTTTIKEFSLIRDLQWNLTVVAVVFSNLCLPR